MSALLALGLATGYVINKNLSLKQKILEVTEDEEREQARVHTEGGSSYSEIRSAKKRIDNYADMNENLPLSEKKRLAKGAHEISDAVHAYDSAAEAGGPIEGVHLPLPESFP